MPPRAACNAGSAMCAGSCNGVTQTSCTYPGSTTPCPQVCTAGSGNTPAKIAPASCNGNGSCATGVAVNCMGTIKCDALGSSCLAHCASDADCVSADYCSSAGGGTCTPRHGNGASCAPEDCLMSPCNYCSAGSTCAASGQCCPTACVPAACSGGSQTTATCASGSCVPTTSSCNGYACDSATNLCKTACTGDADCLSTFYCDNTGHCAAETKTKNQACNNSACYQGLPCRQCQIDKVCSAGTCP